MDLSKAYYKAGNAIGEHVPFIAKEMGEAAVNAALVPILEALADDIVAEAQQWYNEETDSWEKVNAYDNLQYANGVAELIRAKAKSKAKGDG